jgi:DNA repair protein RecN (Recombination protein N)
VLEEMRIRDLGVIADAVVELGPGLTVLTGETGAGKTMVVTGLGLLLGGRADPGAVRPGADAALVEGRVSVDPYGPVAARAGDAGAELDTDSLLIARTVSAEGRSRAHLGGRTVPASLLGELAADLVAVHGQSDQQRLLRPSRQRQALDRYAGEGLAAVAERYRVSYGRLGEVEATLEEIVTRARERAQEADLLRFGVAEIEAVAPRPREDVELAAEDARLGHADALRVAAQEAHVALLGDEAAYGAGASIDVGALVAAARRALDRVRDHDPALAALGERIAEVGVLLADVGADLSSYAAGIDSDPARLAAVSERRAALAGLLRKYGNDADAVLAWAARASDRLLELDADDSRRDELAAERVALRAQLAEAAADLTRRRQAAADRFADAVSAELNRLAMPQACVSFDVTQVQSAEGLDVDGRTLAFGPHGIDEVEMLLAPHPGAPARPLNRGASGGELSRVMLAVEVVFADADPVPTFVFDEVDAGVGGKAAVEVGRRLALLARTAQVLVVTHLPQVAAYADRHLVVVKSDGGPAGGGTVTSSGVTSLDHAGRVRELSRMLAGQEDSDTARAHAEELLAEARASVG